MSKHKVIPRNEAQYDHLTSEYIVIDEDQQLDHFAHLANDLYNMANYLLRQDYFKHHKFHKMSWLNKQIKHKLENCENMLYGQFPYRQTVQQTLNELTSVWYAWSQAIKAYKANPHKFTGKPRIPGYLPKGKRHVFFVTGQNSKVKNGYLIIQPRNGLMNFKLKLRLGITNVCRIAFKPLSRNRFKVIVQYKTKQKINYKPDNGRYMGIDPGLDNAFACAINDSSIRPLLISGLGIKSVNREYNKRIAKLSKLHADYSQCCYYKPTKQGIKRCFYYSKQQTAITDWRNAKIREFAHQASKRIVDYALSNDVNTIIIGKNKNQKRSIHLGKKTNQNFVGIPHVKMIEMIKYKANQHGITVIATPEGYTSQTSFLDNEKPCKQNGEDARRAKGLTPVKRRIKRGLFKTDNEYLINADVNGALQIIKKVYPNVSFADGLVGAVLRPVKLSMTF